MAISAVITLTDGSANVAPEAEIPAVCVVTNTGGSSVNITNVVPTCAVPAGGTAGSGSIALGGVRPVLPLACAGSSGTATVTFVVVPHAPKKAGPSTMTYDIGATIYTSDGAITFATVDTLTVAAPT